MSDPFACWSSFTFFSGRYVENMTPFWHNCTFQLNCCQGSSSSRGHDANAIPTHAVLNTMNMSVLTDTRTHTHADKKKTCSLARCTEETEMNDGVLVASLKACC